MFAPGVNARETAAWDTPASAATSCPDGGDERFCVLVIGILAKSGRPKFILRYRARRTSATRVGETPKDIQRRSASNALDIVLHSTPSRNRLPRADFRVGSQDMINSTHSLNDCGGTAEMRRNVTAEHPLGLPKGLRRFSSRYPSREINFL